MKKLIHTYTEDCFLRVQWKGSFGRSNLGSNHIRYVMLFHTSLNRTHLRFVIGKQQFSSSYIDRSFQYWIQSIQYATISLAKNFKVIFIYRWNTVNWNEQYISLECLIYNKLRAKEVVYFETVSILIAWMSSSIFHPIYSSRPRTFRALKDWLPSVP